MQGSYVELSDVEHVRKMKKLRTFALQFDHRPRDNEFYHYFNDHEPFVTFDFIELLVEIAPKVRTLMLWELDKSAVQALSVFARAHPKRQIAVYNFYCSTKQFKKLNLPANLRIIPSIPPAANL